MRLSQWTFAFVPFCVLLTAALLIPELLTPGGTPNLQWLDDLVGLDDPTAHPVPTGTPLLPLYRAILTIWLSTVLLIPAISLFVLQDETESGRRLGQWALLFWTFSYLSYLVHFYYTAFVIFGGIEGTFQNMRPWVAGTNFLLTGWWTLDVLIAWTTDPDRTWVRVERWAAHIFIFLVYVVTDLFLRPTFVRYLGMALVVCVVFSLLIRFARTSVSPVTTSRST
jgi:hypothetical protein